MNLTLLTQRIGIKPLAGVALAVGILCGLTSALAVSPAAGTSIGNLATANYSDANGNPQTSTSNKVQTTVQQVGSFTLDTVSSVTTTVANTKFGGAGATVYVSHTITNTGNGNDTFAIKVDSPAAGFSKVEVFSDADGDGVADATTTALCSAVPSATCSIAPQTVNGSNGVLKFVVAYSIPSTATTPTLPFSSGTVTVTPTNTALYTGSNVAAADVDNINLTTSSAFNMTKTTGKPTVAAAGGAAWPTTIGSDSSRGPRSASAACPTAFASITPLTCDYTVFTLTLSNTGGSTGKFAVSDTLPSGFTYVTGSAVWSNAPGTALGDGVGGDPVGIDFQASGGTITAVIAAMNPNVTQTLSFVVLVNSTAAVGTTTTSNIANFSPVDSPAATSLAIGTLASTTNSANFTVTPTRGVVMGAATSTVTNAVDTTAGTPNGTANDQTTIATAVAGSSAKFLQTIFNTGNDNDTFNVAVSGTNNFPAGTTFTFFNGAGGISLLDTNADSIPDTGPIASGASVNVIVQANIPPTAVLGSGPFSVIIAATSINDATKVDATNDTVTLVVGSLADLTNTAAGTGAGGVLNGDLGQGPSPSPTVTNTVVAGTGSVFPLFIKNGDSIANTFTLAASQGLSFSPGTLPPGWTVKFVAGGTGCAGLSITTVTVPPLNGQVAVDACVTPAATQVAITAQKLYFQIVSTAVASTGVTISDTLLDALTVTVKSTYSAAFTSLSFSNAASPGGSVVYAHTLDNTGNQDCVGPITLSATMSAADVTLGWSSALILDVNGDGKQDIGDTVITGPITATIAALGNLKFLVKIFPPSGAAINSTDTVTVTASFPAGATSCGTTTATDITTVVAGQIRVFVTQALNALCDNSIGAQVSTDLPAVKPGACLTYVVVATNEGTAAVNNVSISNVVPLSTTLNATQPAVQCVASPLLSGTPVAYASSGSVVSCGSASNILGPSGTITLSFTVKVNP